MQLLPNFKVISFFFIFYRQTEYSLNVEEYIRTKDPTEEDDEDPPDIDDLKKDIYFHRSQEAKLKDEIPEFVTVSMFQVDCREFREVLSGKHAQIAEREVLVIAKRAKEETSNLLNV
jgi:hypothetical protein